MGSTEQQRITDTKGTKAHNSSTDYEEIDQSKLQEFLGKLMFDVGAAMSAVLVNIGDSLGLYKAIANEKGSSTTVEELARNTGVAERCVREWLANQAASGYILYDSNTKKYSLPKEHALALADDNSPVYAIGSYQTLKSLFRDEEKILKAFKTGRGLKWGDHDANLFEGTERFFGANYKANIVQSWIPSINGGRVEEKLKQGGARVADVGCGHGISTILMAKAYPNSKFIGFDNHLASIKRARKNAKEEGLKEDQIRFELASAINYPSSENDRYDLIAFFDSFHDMANPLKVAKHALKALKEDGTVMLVEPFANDKLEDNLNPLGRMYYAASCMICTLSSMASSGSNGPVLGAQAGEAKIAEIIKNAGFKHFRRAVKTPINLVYEAKR